MRSPYTQRPHQITPQTAGTDLVKLAALGPLEQRKRGRAFVFYVPGDLGGRIRAAGQQNQ